MLEEQRAHRRYPILLTGSASSGRSRFEVVCTNIGPGGAFFASRVDPVAAAEVEVTLHLLGPASPPVSLTGTVVYVTGRGNGRVGGFGVRWLRARSDFGPDPLRQLLSEVVHVVELGDLAPDEAGTSRFEFGKVRRPPPPTWPARRPSDAAMVAAALPEIPLPSPAVEPTAEPSPLPEAETPDAAADSAGESGPAAGFLADLFAGFEVAAAAPSAEPTAQEPDKAAEPATEAGPSFPEPAATPSATDQALEPQAAQAPPAGQEPQAPRRIFAASSTDSPVELADVASSEVAVAVEAAPAEPLATAGPPAAAVPAAVAAESVPVPQATAVGRTSSVMRRLAATWTSTAQVAAAAAPPPATPVAPPPPAPAPVTRLSSVLRRVRAAQEARTSQLLEAAAAQPQAEAPPTSVAAAREAAEPHQPPPDPRRVAAADARVLPPALPNRRSAPVLVSAAVEAPQGTGPDGQNEHTVAYIRESPAIVRGRRPTAPASWPAGIPASLADRYDQLQLIGQGGHGVVYRAVDRHLNRQVVLKFLAQSSVATEIARKYFLREVKLAASLNHSNIVHIYDIAKVEDVLYYAMEFVDGVPLTAYLPTGTPIADEAFLFSVFTQICDALDHAHAQGVLHRDVKPENVLVAPDGMVKLFDFGLAWAQGEGFGEHSVLMGTPYYMAPEQLLGADVDHRADIYALGVVLFRMLAGVLPFSDGNIFAAHAIEPVPDPRRWNPLVAPAAVAVVHSMMAKQPSHRPIDCRTAAIELYNALFVDRGGVL